MKYTKSEFILRFGSGEHDDVGDVLNSRILTA